MSSTFPRTKSSRRGYDVDQVEDFLEEARVAYSSDPLLPTPITSETIRHTAFSMAKGGYSPIHVDAALERLEDAFAERERERALAAPGGDQEWYANVRGTARVIIDRLERPSTEKFVRVGPVTTGYSVKAVDDFAEKLIQYFRNGATLSVEDVRTVIFPGAKRGYSEAQVDLLLDTVVKVMLAVR